jgi:undecaprenyl-diphosphatase
METYQAIILGILQGIFEWLPVSSEGIISLIMINLFGFKLQEAIFLAIWLHTGTLFAAIIYFRNEVKGIISNIIECLTLKRLKNNNLTSFLIISTILTGVVGVPILIFGIVKINLPGNLATVLIGLLLIITGIANLSLKKMKSSKQIRTNDAIPVGLLQGFAALPGISRSGITVATLLFLGYSAKKAIDLSFLMSIPVVLIAGIGLAFFDKIVFDFNSILATIFSFIVGFITIKFLIKAAKKLNFGYFCIFIGILSCLALFL